MGGFSFYWMCVILICTYGIYKIVTCFIKDKRNKQVWLVALLSIFIYSGIGIAYSSVSKINLLYYIIYLLVLGFTFIIFTSTHLIRKSHRLYISTSVLKEYNSSFDEQFWNSTFVSTVFIQFLILYFILRVGSLVYPVNKLGNLTIEYNAVNNLKNINGENANILNSIASYIRPCAYIGMYFACKKVKYVAVLLGLDLVITLLATGYLSRNLIIAVLIITLLLYFNNDLNNSYISSNRKKKRIIITLCILIPLVLEMMIYLMSIRTQSGSNWTIVSFISSEIDYPKYYAQISFMEKQLITSKDMFLHMLDSFIPVIPTPGYVSNFNVLFSEYVTGVRMNVTWFSVLLPGLLGEARLIFGSDAYWVHAVVISFIMSLITRIVGNNKQMTILYYYYLTCVMKTARAGYEELSGTVLFNFIFIYFLLFILKLIYKKING